MSDPVDPADAKKPLTPANQNPWYVLMTLYGEQEGGEIDWELHEKNRKAWNAWAGQALNEDEWAEAAKSSGVTVEELATWPSLRKEIEALHQTAWQARNPDGMGWPGLPSPDQVVPCSRVLFQNHLCAHRFIFPAFISFSKATFNGRSEFYAATFRSWVEFTSATFGGDAEFSFATIIGHAWFTSATFNGQAGFVFSTFSGQARFLSSTFIGEAAFGTATFSEEAEFSSATFSGEARFSIATFSKEASFVSATFSGLTYFVATSFGAEGGGQGAFFQDCHFAKPTNFRDARFLSGYPDFEGAVLHPETTFTAKAEDEDGPFWPPSPADPVSAKNSCAKIRNNLAKQGLPDDEHFFYRKEMRFAGMAASNPVEKLAYWLFGALSDYGYSFVRPAVAMAAVFAFGLVAYLGFFMQGTALRPLGTALGLSFSNLFPYFGLARQYGLEEVAKDLPAVLKVLGGVQTVAGAILLFLFALGLRTRFRMR